MAQLVEQHGRKHGADIQGVIERRLATPGTQYEKKDQENEGEVQAKGHAKKAQPGHGSFF